MSLGLGREIRNLVNYNYEETISRAALISVDTSNSAAQTWGADHEHRSHPTASPLSAVRVARRRTSRAPPTVQVPVQPRRAGGRSRRRSPHRSGRRPPPPGPPPRRTQRRGRTQPPRPDRAGPAGSGAHARRRSPQPTVKDRAGADAVGRPAHAASRTGAAQPSDAPAQQPPAQQRPRPQWQPRRAAGRRRRRAVVAAAAPRPGGVAAAIARRAAARASGGPAVAAAAAARRGPRRRRRVRRSVMVTFTVMVLLILLVIGDRVAAAITENAFASQFQSQGGPGQAVGQHRGLPVPHPARRQGLQEG